MTEDRIPTGKNQDYLAAAADQFKPGSMVVGIREYGNGNVHDTFLVTLASGGEEHFILQRVNTGVFRQPEQVMRNMRTVTEHARRSLEHASPSFGRRWEVPRVLAAEDARDYWIDPGGSYWRAISFIEAAQAFDTIQDLAHAREVGMALGMFHGLIRDLPPDGLIDTLPGFHIAPHYLRHYDRVSVKNGAPHSPKVEYCRRFVKERRDFARVLEDAKAGGLLGLRPTHGDPKVNNV